MPLSEVRLSGKIEAIMDDYDNITPAEKAVKRKDFADKLALAIIEEIKEAKVNYSAGLTAGANSVIGVFNHTIS